MVATDRSRTSRRPDAGSIPAAPLLPRVSAMASLTLADYARLEKNID
jgi:hypothetical protein